MAVLFSETAAADEQLKASDHANERLLVYLKRAKIPLEKVQHDLLLIQKKIVRLSALLERIEPRPSEKQVRAQTDRPDLAHPPPPPK